MTNDNKKLCPLNQFKLCQEELCAWYMQPDGLDEECSVLCIAKTVDYWCVDGIEVRRSIT